MSTSSFIEFDKKQSESTESQEIVTQSDFSHTSHQPCETQDEKRWVLVEF